MRPRIKPVDSRVTILKVGTFSAKPRQPKIVSREPVKVIVKGINYTRISAEIVTMFNQLSRVKVWNQLAK